MNKIGTRETSLTIIFLMLPQLIFRYIGHGLTVMNNGYIINFVVCFLIFTVIAKLCSGALRYNLIRKYEWLDKVINLICMFYVFNLTIYNLSLCTGAMESISKYFTPDVIAFVPLVAAVLCAVLGIESLSRSSYISFFIALFIILFIATLTISGWNRENIYPILGSSVNDIFSDYSTLGCFFALLSVYVLKENFKEETATYHVLKRSLSVSFFCGIAVVIICIFTIPFPMGQLYDFSMSGIFSMAKSGTFFHRFELLLEIMILIFYIISTALGLYLLSVSVAGFIKAKDHTPFIFIFGIIVFYSNLLYKNTNVLFAMYLIWSVIFSILLMVKSLFVRGGQS